MYKRQLEDGTLLRAGREDRDPRFRGGGIGGRIQKLAPDGTVLWHWQLAGEKRQQHHDLEPLPNGNVLLITWERVPRLQAIAHGRDPRQVGEVGLWPDAVLEIQPLPPDRAKVVWEWRAWDHLVQDAYEARPDYGMIAEHPGRIDLNGEHRDAPPLSEEELRRRRELEEGMEALGYFGGDEGAVDPNSEVVEKRQKSGDWLHTNSVDYHAEYDLIVLSTPEFSELWVIDHSTTTAEAATGRGGRWGRGGDLLWRWGNPRMYGAGGDSDRRLFYQHDPTWIPGKRPGELRLLVFNNGGGRPGEPHSSVEELVLPFDPKKGFQRESGKAYGPAEPAWIYADPKGFYSAFISGSQRLPNGNTLICSGVPGRLFEVTAEGRIVWDYRNPHGGDVEPPEHAGQAPPLALFRGTRLARDHPGVLRLLKK